VQSGVSLRQPRLENAQAPRGVAAGWGAAQREKPAARRQCITAMTNEKVRLPSFKMTVGRDFPAHCRKRTQLAGHRGFGVFLLLDRLFGLCHLKVDLEPHGVAYQPPAGVERNVPGETPIASFEGAR
jgi:hypothetical protein